MTNRKRTNKQTVIYKTLYRKQEADQHQPTKTVYDLRAYYVGSGRLQQVTIYIMLTILILVHFICL